MGTFTRGATIEPRLSIITATTLCFLSKTPFIDPFSVCHTSYDTTYLSWREFLVLFTLAPAYQYSMRTKRRSPDVRHVKHYRIGVPRLMPLPRTGAFTRAPLSRARRPPKMNQNGVIFHTTSAPPKCKPWNCATAHLEPTKRYEICRSGPQQISPKFTCDPRIHITRDRQYFGSE